MYGVKKKRQFGWFCIDTVGGHKFTEKKHTFIAEIYYVTSKSLLPLSIGSARNFNNKI
jgi:hypothetical protein